MGFVYLNGVSYPLVTCGFNLELETWSAINAVSQTVLLELKALVPLFVAKMRKIAFFSHFWSDFREIDFREF